MNTKNLLYITTIAQEGNLSGAARRLGVSQPTLSSFLFRLETTLGVDLFIREKKRLIPTPAGKIYLDAAAQIFQVKDLTYQGIYRLTHDLTETITVGATPLRGSIMVARIFPQFSKQFPNVKIELKESYMKDLKNLVRNNQVNFALGSCYDSEDPELDYIIVAKEEVVIGVPAFHQLASQAGSDPDLLTSIDIQKFVDSPFILLSPGTTIRAIADHIFSNAGFSPTVVFETNNNLVVSNMIHQGAGIGLLPHSSIVKDDPNIVYFSCYPRYYLNLCIIMSKNKKLTEAERYLAYLVIKQDSKNPLYLPSYNAAAADILNEFYDWEESR